MQSAADRINGMWNFSPLAYGDYSQRRRCSLAVPVALLCLATASWAQDEGGSSPTPKPSFNEQVENRVLSLANDFRGQHGLKPLEREARLGETARYFADYTARTGKLEHDADGSTPAKRVAQRGYDYCVIAENIAYEYSSRGFTPEQLAHNFVEGWQQSPTHRANMLEPKVTQTGVAVASSPKRGEYYVVQLFGRPPAPATDAKATGRSKRSGRC